MKPQKRLSFLLLFLLWSLGSHAQYLHADFARHLSDSRNYQEVIDLTNEIPPMITKSGADSLYFYRAWAMYNLKRVSEGVENFRKVSSNSRLFKRSMFFSAWSLSYLGKYDEAKHDLALIKNPDKLEQELIQIQYSGLYILNSHADSALLVLNKLRKQTSIYIDQIDLLKDKAIETMAFRPRSMVVSGLLSAIVPGAGKIYAGEKGTGIGSFLLLAGLGGMTAENILKSGIASWNSILITGLFSIFYLGNVYGSIISIKTYRERFYEGQEQAIVATMLIPLRDYYR